MASGKEEAKASGLWYTLVEGKFRTKVNEDTPNAVRRDWTTPDGKSGVKYELVYNALFGKIEGIKVVDGDYGKQIVITLEEDEDGQTPVIALSADSKYGVDFMKRLPNAKLDQPIRFIPFDFEDEKGKRLVGLRLEHKDDAGKYTVKIQNYFSDGEKALHDFPVPPANAKEIWDKKDWKNYFDYTIVKFLLAHLTENTLPKFGAKVSPGNSMPDYPEEVINPEDIPF